jgi:hypothetical protein
VGPQDLSHCPLPTKFSACASSWQLHHQLPWYSGFQT